MYTYPKLCELSVLAVGHLLLDVEEGDGVLDHLVVVRHLFDYHRVVKDTKATHVLEHQPT
jgi:hypothetical protein